MSMRVQRTVAAMTPAERAECARHYANMMTARKRVSEGLAGFGNKPKPSKADRQAIKAAKAQEKKERKALNKLLSNKEKKQAEKEARQARKEVKSAGGFIGQLNNGRPASLPLTEEAERFRQASVAGDFATMNSMAPFGHSAWAKNTSLGKYRFNIVDGKPQYVPWSDADLTAFLSGTWMQRDPNTGLSPLVHPSRTREWDFNDKLKKLSKHQQNRIKKYSPSDPRYVYDITPGQYVIGEGDKSTWVKIRKPVAVAALAVASVYLGPVVYAKLSAAMASEGATAAGTAAGTTATTGSTLATAAEVSATAAKLASYVNDARTIKAIAEGKAPPPPIDLSSGSFTDWALQAAADQYGRKLTADEETQLRQEIQQLQSQYANVVPSGTATTNPSPDLSPQVVALQTQEENKQAANSKLIKTLLLIGIPTALLLMGS